MGLNLNIPKPEKEDNKEEVKLISLLDCVKNNIKKINSTLIDVTGTENVLLFKTDKGKLLLFEDCHELLFNDFVIDQINVNSSGFMIFGKEFKTYVSRTNIVQFKMVDTLPLIYMKYSREGKLVESQKASYKYSELQDIILLVKGVCPKLFELVKDIDNKKLILEKVFEFENKLIDINYAIKINKHLLMNANFLI